MDNFLIDFLNRFAIQEYLNIAINVTDIIYGLTVAFIVILVILENHDPVKTMAWVLVLTLVPIGGIVLYFLFGRNFRKVKALSKKAIQDVQQIKYLRGTKVLDLPRQEIFNYDKIKHKLPIINLLQNNSKALLTENNNLTVLNNGDETFPSLFEALKMAKDHIHFQFYVIDNGRVGDHFKTILIEKAREGVEVRIILDAVGSWSLSNQYIEELKNEGIEVFEFRPVRFPHLTTRINYRNHRKIVVIDGHTGFIGGLNIADIYLYGDEKLGFWRDMHLKIDGDAVNSLQTVFLTDWHFVSGKDLEDQKYFPDTEVSNKCPVQIATSGPDTEWASIMQAYFAAISTAKHYIYISNPYFTPNESILTALKTAALSGIDVRLVLPGKSDFPIHLWSSFSFFEELMRAGVRIFIYDKGFNHGKYMLVDGIFSSIGTANMDIRSFDQNLEANALVYDESVTKKLEQDFANDLNDSQELKLETFLERPHHKKIRESLARVFSPLL